MRQMRLEVVGRMAGGQDMGRGVYMEFLKKCTGVREVTLRLHVRDLIVTPLRQKRNVLVSRDVPLRGMQTSYHLLGLDEIVALYALEGMFEMRGLNRVALEIVSPLWLFDERGAS